MAGQSGTSQTALSVAVAGSNAYVLGDSGMSWAFDVSNPAQPRRVAGNSGFEAWNVVTQGSQVCVAAGVDGLAILNAYPPPLQLAPPILSAASVTLSWNGGAGIRLQKTTSLTNPAWQDVPGSAGVSSIEVPRKPAVAFFRLIQP